MPRRSAPTFRRGHRWSFERGGFAGAPSTNTVFLQSFNGSQWNLAPTNYGGGSNHLAGRFQKYRDALNGTSVLLLTAQSFSLESTTSLNVTDSWLAVTNVPAVVDLQNTVTNPISGEARFYRLKK